MPTQRCAYLGRGDPDEVTEMSTKAAGPGTGGRTRASHMPAMLFVAIQSEM